ncbi:glycosyltransferase family 2 protein [Pelagicoccus enzymogenes]|uniref:glycosyltransferase family 2 protein n=1 Tax=Pelagicoccus enzymogenes TaxID=2773457 RepID=UPI00280DE2B1|nr:glycosyltransferase family 2 protein [Pelagicoccus enzymogenes]MDQ8197555.1 glycosyltransferase family 2 protein [Pelagicoccus enzymogenes]
MRFSVVTALFNGLDYTKKYLESLESTLVGVDYELILVDDGSSDGTRAYLKSLEGRTKVKVLLNDRNLGFAKSNNLACRQATGDYLVFLNNDILLSPGWLEPMVSASRRTHPWMGHRRRAGVVGNVQRRMDDKRIDHGGIYINLYAAPHHAFQDEAELPACGAFTAWSAATAACWLMERSHFSEFGGFDERYLNGMEDIDFCLQSLQAGRVAVVANRSVIEHAVSASRDSSETSERNERLFWEKWRYPVQEMALIDQVRYLWLRELELHPVAARWAKAAAQVTLARFRERLLKRAKPFVLPPEKQGSKGSAKPGF